MSNSITFLYRAKIKVKLDDVTMSPQYFILTFKGWPAQLVSDINDHLQELKARAVFLQGERQ